MSSTGGKSGGKRLDPLTLSVDKLMHPDVGTSLKTSKPTSTLLTVSNIIPINSVSGNTRTPATMQKCRSTHLQGGN
jgi:hypothetical protein